MLSSTRATTIARYSRPPQKRNTTLLFKEYLSEFRSNNKLECCQDSESSSSAGGCALKLLSPIYKACYLATTTSEPKFFANWQWWRNIAGYPNVSSRFPWIFEDVGQKAAKRSQLERGTSAGRRKYGVRIFSICVPQSAWTLGQDGSRSGTAVRVKPRMWCGIGTM